MKPRDMKSRKPRQEWSAARSAARYSHLRDLYVSYEGHSDTIITRLPDISTKGMFINTARSFPEGAVLNVRFRLARTGAEVHSRCEVRYCFEGVGIGVEFIDISPNAVAAIEKELRPGSHSGGASEQRSSPPQRKRKSGRSPKPAHKRRKR